MSDHIDQAARCITANFNIRHQPRDLAAALADAGLLVTAEQRAVRRSDFNDLVVAFNDYARYNRANPYGDKLVVIDAVRALIDNAPVDAPHAATPKPIQETS